jgi:hypothetical protein
VDPNTRGCFESELLTGKKKKKKKTRNDATMTQSTRSLVALATFFLVAAVLPYAGETLGRHYILLLSRSTPSLPPSGWS